MRIFYFSLIVFALCSAGLIGYAQNGCVIVYGPGSAGTVVYTSSKGTTTTCNGQTVENFNTSPSVALASGCQWNPYPATAPATLRNCIVNGSCGVKNNYTQLCPLDDYVWILIVIVSGLGFYLFRNRFDHLSPAITA